MAYSPLPALHYGPVAWQPSRPQISTTCTALDSKELGLAACTHSRGRRGASRVEEGGENKSDVE